MDFRFYNQFLRYGSIQMSHFFVLTTVAGFYTKSICTCPKGTMQGQSPIRNVTWNIWVPAKQYKCETEVSLKEYHKEPHFWPVWWTVVWCKLLVWIQRTFLFSVHISFSSYLICFWYEKGQGQKQKQELALNSFNSP